MCESKYELKLWLLQITLQSAAYSGFFMQMTEWGILHIEHISLKKYMYNND